MKSIRIVEDYISLINTCTFDSIEQVMFCAYADSELYQDFVERRTENKFMESVSHAVRDGITVKSYRKRAMLLKDLFKNQCTTELTVINAACTTQFMIKKIFANLNTGLAQIDLTNSTNSTEIRRVTVRVRRACLHLCS